MTDSEQYRSYFFGAQDHILSSETLVKISDDFYLGIDGEIPIIPLTMMGESIGYLLGYPVLIDGKELLLAGYEVNSRRTQNAVSETLLEALGGSFLLIVSFDGLTCAYPDAAATMGLVYSPARQCASSSPSSILGAGYDQKLRRDLISAFGANRDGWFSGGLTAHDGVFRLLPNHRLNFATWQCERFWPNRLPEYTKDVDPHLVEMGDEIDAIITALTKAGPATQTLTGGSETRALLACNKSSRAMVEFMTLAVPGASLDLHLAKTIMKVHGGTHKILNGKKATATQTENWRKEAGHCLSGMNALYYPSVKPLGRTYLVGGVGGEVGRGFLWPEGLTENHEVDARFLLTRLKLPHHPLLLSAFDRWLAGLPEGLDAFQILDLAFLELRVGPWAFGQPNFSDNPINIHPLISRRQFARMLSMPPGFRKNSGFIRRLIELKDPLLLKIPINRYGDWRDTIQPLLCAMQRPDRAWKKLKQIVGTFAGSRRRQVPHVSGD